VEGRDDERRMASILSVAPKQYPLRVYTALQNVNPSL
jgi:hypothetical protein